MLLWLRIDNCLGMNNLDWKTILRKYFTSGDKCGYCNKEIRSILDTSRSKFPDVINPICKKCLEEVETPRRMLKYPSVKTYDKYLENGKVKFPQYFKDKQESKKNFSQKLLDDGNVELMTKADFSFRNIIKNSRGILGKIFRRLDRGLGGTDTSKLSESAGELAGEFYLTLESIPLSVAKKTKLIEQLLTEPILSIIEDLNDEEKAGKLEELAKLRIKGYSSNSDSTKQLTEEQIKQVKEVSSKIANNIKGKIQNNIEQELDNILDEIEVDEEYENIDWYDKNNKVKQGIAKILGSKEFSIGYVAALTYSMLRNILIQSHMILEETTEDPTVRVDEELLDENTFGETLDEYKDDLDKSWKDRLRK